jgi:hypothetical protein
MTTQEEKERLKAERIDDIDPAEALHEVSNQYAGTQRVLEELDSVLNKPMSRRKLLRLVKHGTAVSVPIAAAEVAPRVIGYNQGLISYGLGAFVRFLGIYNQHRDKTTDFQKFIEAYSEFSDFTQGEYELALVYKENFPQAFDDTRLHPHLHDRIKREVADWDYAKQFDSSIGSVVDRDIVEHIIVPHFKYDLEVNGKGKDMFGFDYGFSLYDDILKSEIPDRSDRRVVWQNRARLDTTLDVNNMQLTTPSKQTAVNNMQTIINSKLRGELLNTFKDPDSEEHKKIIDQYEKTRDNYATNAGLGVYYHNSGAFFRDNLDPILAKDERMSLHRFTVALSDSRSYEASEWRVPFASTIAKIYGGSVLGSTIVYDGVHDDPIQAYTVPLDMLREFSRYGTIIKLPGQAVSMSAPALEPARKDGLNGMGLKIGLGDRIVNPEELVWTP